MPFGGGGSNAVTRGDAASGDLTGTYPGPQIANLAVLTQHIGNSQVTPAKIAAGHSTVNIEFDTTLGADTASAFDTGVSGISASGLTLMICLLLRTDEAAVTSSCLLRFNGDSGANYDYQIVNDLNTTVTGVQTLAGTSWQLFAHGALGDASGVSVQTILLPGYLGTTYHKAATIQGFVPDSTPANVFYRSAGGRWKSTAAINQVSVARGGGTVFKAGSRVTIYSL